MQHTSLSKTDHRPWPLPAGPWSWRQSWQDLLFAHWPVPASDLQRLVPDGLTIQEFGGTSWIGIVPFRMSGVMRRPFPDMPWISAFPELNVRLYVEREGKPGVWFLSLDAANSLAVWAGRKFFHLPYHLARIDFKSQNSGFHFRSERSNIRRNVVFEAAYRPTSEPCIARPESLEEFLVERYCLYACNPAGRLGRLDVHHVPWPLQKAEGDIFADELLKPLGIPVGNSLPLLHFSRGVEVVAWSLRKADR